MKRYAQDGGSRDCGAELLLMLIGHSPSIADIDDLHRRGIAFDAFEQFCFEPSPAEFLRLWRRHEVAVRDECERRQIPVKDPATFVDATHWIRWSGGT